MVEIIPLFAGLELANVGGNNDRVTISFTAPDLSFGADEREIAKLACDAIAEQVKGNLLAGRAPDGSPLPEVALSTVIRREYRQAQGERGGFAAPRYSKPVRVQAAKNWRRRFQAPRLGKFEPIAGSRTFGIDSGMLANSPVPLPAKGGNGWTVWFAASRARRDKKGQSALDRVFARIPLWSDKASAQPRMQEALRKVGEGLLVSRAMRLLNELQRTAENTQELAEGDQ